MLFETFIIVKGTKTFYTSQSVFVMLKLYFCKKGLKFNSFSTGVKRRCFLMASLESLLLVARCDI